MESHEESCRYCHCHDELCAPCTDFEKMLELGGGLVIYKHKPPPDICRDSNRNDLLIIYNSKNVAITTADIIPEIDKSRISCPRCRRLMEHAKRFLQDMPSIEKNKVVSVCEHCRQKAQYRYPCHECENFLKKFIATMTVKRSEKKLAEVEDETIHVKILIDELDKLKIKTVIPSPATELQLQGSRNITEHDVDLMFDTDITSDKEKKEQFPKRVIRAPVQIKSDISVKKSLSDDSLLQSVGKFPIERAHSLQEIADDDKKSNLVKHFSDDKIASKRKRDVRQNELDESFLDVVADPSKSVDSKGFRYLFPRDKSKKYKGSDIHVTSSQLITETRDRLLTKLEEKKKKQEEVLQKIFEQKEKKRIAREEKIRLVEEEKKRLDEEENKTLDGEKKGILTKEKLKRIAEKDLLNLDDDEKRKQYDATKKISLTEQEHEEHFDSKQRDQIAKRTKQFDTRTHKGSPVFSKTSGKSREAERNLSEKHRDEPGKFATKKGEKHKGGEKPHMREIEKGVETGEKYSKGKKDKHEKVYGEKDEKQRGSDGQSLKDRTERKGEKGGTLSQTKDKLIKDEKQRKIGEITDKDEKQRGSDREHLKDRTERKGEKGGTPSQTKDKLIKDKDSRFIKTGEQSIKETESKQKEGTVTTAKEKDDKSKGKESNIPKEKYGKEGQMSKEKDDKTKEKDALLSREKEGRLSKESDQKSKEKGATVSKEKDEVHKKLDTSKEADDKQKDFKEKGGKVSKETESKLKDKDAQILKDKTEKEKEGKISMGKADQSIEANVPKGKDIIEKGEIHEKSKEIDSKSKGKDGKVTKETYTKQKDEISKGKKATKEMEETVPDQQKGDKHKDEIKRDTKKTKDELNLASQYLANQAKTKQEEEKLKKDQEALLKKAKEAADKAEKSNISTKGARTKRPLPDAKALKPEEEKVQQTQTKGSGKTVKDEELNAKQIKLSKPSHDDLLLQLVKLKQREPRAPKPVALPVLPEIKIKKRQYRRRSKKSTDDMIVSSDSDLSLGNLDRKGRTFEDNDSIIIGPKIYKNKNKILVKQKNEKGKEELLPILFKSAFTAEPLYKLHEEIETAVPEPLSSALKQPPAEPTEPKGILRYALSDRTFIEKGWTLLPTEKVVRKMNVYRMRPAHPEFDWFEHNKNKRLMNYDSGEKLAEFNDNGRGRWFYKNGRVALDYYDAEETNAQQRFVIYSNGELDQRGRSHPITVLATFDYLGNGVVFDHGGKIRIKYNQTEGVVLDRALGPVSHWKWHSLNDPPVLQQVMIDTHMSHKDPEILKLPGEETERIDNEEMLAIEFDNFIKEKSKKLNQKFKPFQIKMKALKINEQFSLRILDQATIYLIFRDGTTCLKMNLGMILDHKEIIDTDTADMGEVSNTLERLPARTESIGALQRSVAFAQRVERSRTERERRLRPPEPCESSDLLTAGLSKPLRQAIIGASSGHKTCTTNSSCKYRKPSTTNIYYEYNTRLI